MQKESNSDVARFSTHIKLVLQQISFFASCEKLLQKVESSSTFCKKICSFYAFYQPKVNLFDKKWRNFRL